MFEALLSKLKKNPGKETTKLKKPATKVKAVKDVDGKSDKILMFSSIGLIVLGVSAIAFEFVTTSDSPPPMPQQTILKPAAKPPVQAKPATSPASATAAATSAPVAASAPASVGKEGMKSK